MNPIRRPLAAGGERVASDADATIRGMASGWVRDPNGRVVELTNERWAHIVDRENGHPELVPFRDDVLRTVQAPERRLAGRRPNEEWLYLSGVGPSRWLKVVVAYDEGGGRVITAFARRRLP